MNDRLAHRSLFYSEDVRVGRHMRVEWSKKGGGQRRGVRVKDNLGRVSTISPSSEGVHFYLCERPGDRLSD